MYQSGIPYYRIRLVAGNVTTGGHLWCTYLRESDNRWYVLDGTWYPEKCLNWNMPWKHAYINDEISKKFGINGIPELFLIDNNGLLIYKMQEEKDSSLENLTKILVERL